MRYPTLLLYLDDDARAPARLEFAARLARRFASHLVGLSCHRPVPSVPATGPGILGVDALTIELAQARERATSREQAFRTQCDALELTSFEAQADDDDEPGRAIVLRGAQADLAILGQPDPADPDPAARRRIVDDVLAHAGRPTLVLPYAGRFERPADVVLVAWDGSAQCARATADALPLLAAARAVHLVKFDPLLGPGAAADPALLAPARRWLARHGVQASASVLALGGNVGEALLSHAADLDADLLVMGAWGHARWQERLLGGATRTVLESMTLPVLFAH